jgi:hypothetical protein
MTTSFLSSGRAKMKKPEKREAFRAAYLPGFFRAFLR